MKFNIGKKVKRMIQNWLQIVPATEQTILLTEQTTFAMEVLRSQIWYRGDTSELWQFFHQLGSDNASFWSSVPRTKEKVRKIHSGLPAIIADTLAYIVYADMDDVEFENDNAKNFYEEFESNHNIEKLIKKAIVDTLVEGDGAFKISVDESISTHPIVEFVGADRVEYSCSRGMLNEVIFTTPYTKKTKQFTLEERYGKGYIISTLYDSNGNEYPLETIDSLAGIEPHIKFDGDFIMAVPVMFYVSKKYPNRGKSIFDGGKSDCFDALDEVISQWWDAIRSGRVNKYIPDFLIPRNPKDGSLQSVNSFGTNFITVTAPVTEGTAPQKIEVVQPDIKYEAYVESYVQCLMMCLQGIVSPATLGIDVGKMQSADAQREKKDVTGNTRNTITAELETVLPKLIEAILKTYDIMQHNVPAEYGDITVSFGEYGAPDFDSRVETVGKASTYGIMSVETQVEELWGSSKDDEWKSGEVKRLMSERGLVTVDEPSPGDS